jgi:hypothetical protein
MSKQLLACLAVLTCLVTLAGGDVAQAQKRCPGLRALDGKCANPAIVEDAQRRAMVISTVRVSYFGTPIGTVGGDYIRFERLFQDNPFVFGLPTYQIDVPCTDGLCSQRTK